MEVKEYKNKIVIAKLDPDADYIMLWDSSYIQAEKMEDFLKTTRVRGARIYVLQVHGVDKAIKFVEIPEKLKHK
jgi:hypothetical protein